MECFISGVSARPWATESIKFREVLADQVFVALTSASSNHH
jgi:hypothetical protein